MSTQEILDSSPAPTAPEDVRVCYPLEGGHRHSSWVVDCGQETASALEMPAGIYTLTQLASGQEQAVRSAERLCALVAHPAVLTVAAVSSSGTGDQIWYEPAEAGTLADYCAAKGLLPLEQVSRVAHDLCAGLTYLHQNQLAFSELTAERVVFTVAGELKLLAPDLDLRAVPQSVGAKHRAENLASVAALLWLCLTGEEAVAQRFRKPLSLSVPAASEALAKTLEDAIDSRSDQPTLQEIAALFELSKDPEPLELHLSAHESVIPRLPAIRPLRYDPVPKERFKRKPVVMGKLQDFSAPEPARGRRRRAGIIGQKPFALGALVLALLGAGTLAFDLLTGAKEAGNSAPLADGAGTQTIAPVADEGAGQETGAVDAGSSLPAESGDYAERFAGLIGERSRVLASGDAGAVGNYAVEGSELYSADRELLAADTAGQLAGMSTSLSGLEEVNAKGTEVSAVLLVEAQGYSPQGDAQDLAAAGMYREGEQLYQRVSLTARWQGEDLLMVSARPVAG